MKRGFDDIRRDGDLLFESVRGSHLFGLNTETSDIDTFGLFCASPDELFGTGLNYSSMVKSEKNDDYWDELSKFMGELKKCNPNIIEALYTPEKWIRHYDPILDPLWKNRDIVLTKLCFSKFKSMAKSQLVKAKGEKKAINTDPKEVKYRKTPLDFCVVPKRDKDGSLGLLKWLEMNGLKQEHCGATRLAGGNEFFSLYYDYDADKELTLKNYSRLKYGHGGILRLLHWPEWKRGKSSRGIKYRGLLDTGNESTQIRCSEISKADSKYPLISFQFNLNAFQDHCTEYKRYWDWVANRNEERYKLDAGYDFNSKNIMHCIRLMTMSIEIAQGKGVILDRTNIDREFLLDINNHKKTFEEVMEYVGKLEKLQDEAFANSTLPDSIDEAFIDQVLIDIRKAHYKGSV